MCDSPHLRAGCTLKHGSGNLMDPMSTLDHVLCSTGVFASKHGLTLGMGCHAMAGPFDLIPSQNLFECKPVAPHMYGEASGTMLRWVILHYRGFQPHAALPGLFLIKVTASYTKTYTHTSK